MKIHEYQAKQLFAQYGVPVPEGYAAFSVPEAMAAADKLPGPVWVVKAQIHAGGRGLGGGVKVCKSKEEVRERSQQILGMMLKTHQTGPEGQLVRRLYIEGGADIKRELYLGMLLDRDVGKIVVMASTEGGMNIEDVAHNTPELISKVWIDPSVGVQAFQGRALAFKLGMTGKTVNAFVKTLNSLYELYMAKDCSLVEINPLVVQGDGSVIALDGKVNFDDNAMYRHPDIMAFRDLDEEDPREIEASKYDLNYVHLDGNVGCLVNGAGLAMATMDIIQYAGGKPANFLDVGGGANEEQVKNAMRIILSDHSVKAVLINIFGGILRCDTLATGVVAAARELNVAVPVVVRMEGTNVEVGRRILMDSGLNFTLALDMRDAAEKVVKLAA